VRIFSCKSMEEGASISLCVSSPDSESLPSDHESRVKIAVSGSRKTFQALTNVAQN
jgi:hypothetical protein